MTTTRLAEKLATLRRKQGYSQQQVADLLEVSRQTISNWELGQGAPALDKAVELARILHVSLDDLARDEVEVLGGAGVADAVGGPDAPGAAPDLHVLESLKGCACRLSCADEDGWPSGPAASTVVCVLDVNADWLRVSYERTRPGTLAQKETVVQLLDVAALEGAVLVGEAGALVGETGTSDGAAGAATPAAASAVGATLAAAVAVDPAALEAALGEQAASMASIATSLDALAGDVHNLGIWLFAVVVLLGFVAYRIPRAGEAWGAAEKQERTVRRRSTNYARQLGRAVGATVELTGELGMAQIAGFDTSRVRVLDCDSQWVLVESTNPKKPGRAILRIAQIEGMRQLAR